MYFAQSGVSCTSLQLPGEFAVMSPLVHTTVKSLNVCFSPISHSLIHISVVVVCYLCFQTMPRAGWMLSKCGFTWAIKWAVLFLCCSDTSVGAAFKGIGLFCSFIYWNAAQFLSLTLKFLSIISCDSFLTEFFTLDCKDHFYSQYFCIFLESNPFTFHDGCLPPVFTYTCCLAVCCCKKNPKKTP